MDSSPVEGRVTGLSGTPVGRPWSHLSGDFETTRVVSPDHVPTPVFRDDSAPRRESCPMSSPRVCVPVLSRLRERRGRPCGRRRVEGTGDREVGLQE